MKRANIRIKGNVQMAGFRTFIKNTADSLNVKGFAENLEDGSVKVICEGEEEWIRGLMDSVKKKSTFFCKHRRSECGIRRIQGRVYQF